MLFLPLGGIQSQGIWQKLKDLDDPELQELASRLPRTVLSV